MQLSVACVPLHPGFWKPGQGLVSELTVLYLVPGVQRWRTPLWRGLPWASGWTWL